MVELAAIGAEDAREWFIGPPLRILGVIAVAIVLRFIVHRAIDRFVVDVVDRRRADQRDAIGELAVLGSQGAHNPSVQQRRAADLARRDGRATQRAETLGAVLKNASSLAIWLVAALIVASELGVDLAPLLAGAGVIGIAVGFGAQSLVRDLLAGIFVITEDQYGVGDIVNLGDATGAVESISLRTTRLRDVEGTLWVVPHGEVVRVANMSQLWALALLDVEVAYGTDLDLASVIIKSVADEVWREAIDAATITAEPKVLGVEELSASAVAIRLSVRCEPGEQWAVKRLLRARIVTAFAEAGIEIPFPQSDIWLRSPLSQTGEPIEES